MFSKRSEKKEFVDEVERLGFENWREGMIAGYVIDEGDFSFNSLSKENEYLLEGSLEGVVWRIRIFWESGKKPRVIWSRRSEQW